MLFFCSITMRQLSRNIGKLQLPVHNFLARDSIICYSALYAIARPSVCLSVMQPLPQSRPMTLVSWRLTSPWNSKGKIGSGGAEWHRGMKNTQFSANKSPYLRNKRCKIGPKLLLITNRNLHMRIRLVPKSSTLGDLEVLRSNFLGILYITLILLRDPKWGVDLVNCVLYTKAVARLPLR